MMALSGEAQVQAVVPQAFAVRSRSPAPMAVIRFDSKLFQHAGADAVITYSRLRFSKTTESIPFKCSRWAKNRPAGPAPIIPTCVCIGYLFFQM